MASRLRRSSWGATAPDHKKGRRSFGWRLNGLAAVVLVYLFVFGDTGLYRLYQMEQEKQRLLLSISQLKVRQRDLEQERALLVARDPAFIEKLAREKLGMARADEWVYRFVPQPGRSTHEPDSSAGMK